MSEIELLFQEASYFGDYAPNVPFAEGVDKDALLARDPNPVFVTLPIAAVGRSRNDRNYTKRHVEQIVEQVNKHRNGGNRGHLRVDERSWKFEMPVLEWVGAIIDPTNGKAYGKAYVPQYATDVREYVLNAKDLRKPIATSIYGTVKPSKEDFDIALETIDLADPFRAGVPDAVAKPIITKEMTNNGEKPMSENQELITELRNDRDKARTELEAAKTQLRELQVKYDAIAPSFDSLKEMSNGKEILAFVSELTQEVKQARRDKLALEINAVIAEQVKLESARPIVLNMLGGVESKADAEKRVAELLKDEGVKTTLKALALMQSGGHAYIGEHQGDDGNKLDESPEALAKAKQLYGIS